MFKHKHNQDSLQQCDIHHLGCVYVRGRPRLLLQHPHGRFLIHETPTQHVPPRERTAVQPEGYSGFRLIRLHGDQEGDTRTQTFQETSQRPFDHTLLERILVVIFTILAMVMCEDVHDFYYNTPMVDF